MLTSVLFIKIYLEENVPNSYKVFSFVAYVKKFTYNKSH